jgi:PPOX class probable F420-dependent enzyme
VRRRVRIARVARLATVGDDGRPHLVPITFALAGDVVYSAVDAKPKRSRDLKRLRNIAGSPDVAVLVDAYDDDWSKLWWCRLEGRARIEESGSEFEKARVVLADKYSQYRVDAPAGPVIAIDVIRWTGWTASEDKGET